MFAWSALSGCLELLGLLDTPPVVQAALPGWAGALWEAVLGCSGVLGLWACLWRQRLWRSLRVEQAALLMGAGPLTFYAAMIVLAPSRAPVLARLVGAGLVGAWTTANAWRAYQIQSEAAELARARARRE